MEEVARYNNQDDVIAVILGLMGNPNQPTKFKGRPQDIHPAVFGLRVQYPLLQGFAFSQYGPFPFSQQLEDALGRLELVKWIKTDNPDFKTYTIGKKIKGIIRSKLWKLFTGEELARLQEIAIELAQVLVIETA